MSLRALKGTSFQLTGNLNYVTSLLKIKLFLSFIRIFIKKMKATKIKPAIFKVIMINVPLPKPATIYKTSVNHYLYQLVSATLAKVNYFAWIF